MNDAFSDHFLLEIMLKAISAARSIPSLNTQQPLSWLTFILPTISSTELQASLLFVFNSQRLLSKERAIVGDATNISTF